MRIRDFVEEKRRKKQQEIEGDREFKKAAIYLTLLIFCGIIMKILLP